MGVAHEVVQVPQGLLIGPDQEDAEKVVLTGPWRMDGQGAAAVPGVRVTVQLAVAVAGQVGDHRLTRWRLAMARERDHGKELADGPGVRQGLEDAEVGVIDIGQFFLQPRQIRGYGPVTLQVVGDTVDDPQVEAFRQGHGPQSHLAAAEEVPDLVQVVAGVVVGLPRVAGGERGIQSPQLVKLGGLTLVQVGGEGPGFEAGHVQGVDDQDRGIGDRGAPGFGDEDRVGDARRVEHAHHRFDQAGGVFLQVVVHAVRAIGVAAFIVHRQTATQVEKAQGGALGEQLDVIAAGLVDPMVDVPEVGDLGAQVAVHQFQTIEQAAGAEVRHQFHELLGGQAKEAAIAAGLGPETTDPRGELEPDAEAGPHRQLRGAGEDEGQFRRGLDDEEAGVAQLLGQQPEGDELPVLVAVADEEGVVARVAAAEGGEGDDQLRLAAGLQAMAVGRAEGDHLLDHLPLLVDLDREDPLVAAPVAEAVDGGGEAGMEAGEAVVEQVLDAYQGRRAQATRPHRGQDVHQGDLDPAGGKVHPHRDLTLVRETEVAFPPLGQAIERIGVGEDPFRRHGNGTIPWK